MTITCVCVIIVSMRKKDVSIEILERSLDFEEDTKRRGGGGRGEEEEMSWMVAFVCCQVCVSE